MGPEGGNAGGYITATGTPEEIAAVRESHTGRYLEEELERHRNGAGSEKATKRQNAKGKSLEGVRQKGHPYQSI
jgi:excinuclease ABC subunit A